KSRSQRSTRKRVDDEVASASYAICPCHRCRERRVVCCGGRPTPSGRQERYVQVRTLSIPLSIETIVSCGYPSLHLSRPCCPAVRMPCPRATAGNSSPNGTVFARWCF